MNKTVLAVAATLAFAWIGATLPSNADTYYTYTEGMPYMTAPGYGYTVINRPSHGAVAGWEATHPFWTMEHPHRAEFYL
ncbi:MAG: hypothetical protein ACRD3W_08715, partial [Terriglobales bacterium]